LHADHRSVLAASVVRSTKRREKTSASWRWQYCRWNRWWNPNIWIRRWVRTL